MNKIIRMKLLKLIFFALFNISLILAQKVNYEIVDRREGDIAECYADPSFANQILNWKTKRGLKEMIEDGWKWQTLNPNGYS